MRRSDDVPPYEYEPGDYGRRGSWWFGKTPNGYLANLSAHQITEHENGTITVSPSILVSLPETKDRPRQDLWHGYLERGVWRSC